MASNTLWRFSALNHGSAAAVTLLFYTYPVWVMLTTIALDRKAPPRMLFVALGLALRGVATAAIDVSDGLLGDLQHVLKASQCGATIDTSIATQLIAACTNESWLSSQFTSQINLQNRLTWVLAGGDDYELLFTAPANARAAVIEAARISATPITRIGRIESETGLRLAASLGDYWTTRGLMREGLDWLGGALAALLFGAFVLVAGPLVALCRPARLALSAPSAATSPKCCSPKGTRCAPWCVGRMSAQRP